MGNCAGKPKKPEVNKLPPTHKSPTQNSEIKNNFRKLRHSQHLQSLPQQRIKVKNGSIWEILEKIFESSEMP